MGSNSTNAKHSFLSIVGHNDLDKSLRIPHGYSPAHKFVSVARHHVTDVFSTAVLLVKPHRCDFFIKEHNGAEVVDCRLRLLLGAVDVIDSQARLGFTHVDQRDIHSGVADGVDMLVRLTALEVINNELAVLH